MKRNQIDFWRLIFMFAVCVLHTGALLTDGYAQVFFSGGYISVEFFFIVSVYYLAASLSAKTDPVDIQKLGSETVHFVWRRAKRLYPEFLCGFILTIVLDQIIYHHTLVYQIKRFLQSGLYEVILLHMADPHSDVIMSVAWYMSALLLASFIIYPFLRVIPDLFRNYLAPLLMLAYLLFSGTGDNITVGNLRVYGIATGGTLRAIAEMAWGTFLYDRIQHIRKTGRFIKTGNRMVWTAI